jgi:replicative superfamily II helicase
VPLTQTFVGVKGNSPTQVSDHMNEVCFEKVLKHVETGDQVMVFVHSRNDTVKTAEALLERARNIGREGGELCSSTLIS